MRKFLAGSMSDQYELSDQVLGKIEMLSATEIVT